MLYGFQRYASEHLLMNRFRHKAPGMSGVNKRILSNLPRNALDIFTLLTNLTFSMGYFPKIFKNGLLVFTGKVGKDPRHVENYRPITLLEIPGKIIERLINDRTGRYFEENRLYNDHQ